MISLAEAFVREVLREPVQSVEFLADIDIEVPKYSHNNLYRLFIPNSDAPVWMVVTQTESSLSAVPLKAEIVETLFPDFLDDFNRNHHPINDSQAQAVSN